MRPRTKASIRTGTNVTESIAPAAIAKVLVKASGLNRRPSWSSRAKTGRNETVITRRLKNSDGPTSLRGGDDGRPAWRSRRQPLDVLVGVLDHDDCRIDHGAERNRDAPEAHDV